MNIDEAREWLRGERSSWNQHAEATDDRSAAFANCARQDAASMEAAYWILRAHRQGLVDDQRDDPSLLMERKP